PGPSGTPGHRKQLLQVHGATFLRWERFYGQRGARNPPRAIHATAGRIPNTVCSRPREGQGGRKPALRVRKTLVATQQMYPANSPRPANARCKPSQPAFAAASVENRWGSRSTPTGIASCVASSAYAPGPQSEGQ